MKGSIVDAIKDLVTENFGREKWEDILEGSGLSRATLFPVMEDVEDETVLRILESLCKVLQLNLKEAADAFGEYWVTVYMPKVYKAYYRGIDNARDFLLKMDSIHSKVTKNIPNAHPPRFGYRWKNSKTLIMEYKSPRGLMDIFIGLIKGVGKFYKTDLKVSKISDTDVEIKFP